MLVEHCWADIVSACPLNGTRLKLLDNSTTTSILAIFILRPNTLFISKYIEYRARTKLLLESISAV
jgi:hypothetical protein